MQKSHHNWGTRSPYYVHPGNDPILSRHAFEAWINDIYPGDGFFYLNHPPNSIATYAVETEGTFRQSIYLERPVSIKSFSVLVGTYGRRAHGNARLSIIKNGNVIYRSHYIPLASINDNTDLTFQGIETALPNGELDFSIEISDLSPGEKLTVWCSPPLWLYKRYSDPSGKSLDQLAMCCSLDLSSRH